MVIPAKKLSNVEISLGTNVNTGNPLALSGAWLPRHIHILGPPGVGKTRLNLALFRQFIHLPNTSVILGNQKGEFFHMARDIAIAAGQAKRLVIFDPGDPEMICGYNPLQPNGLTVATHAKQVRESIRAAWGQSSFDQTPQLARLLYIALYVARELELTLSETLGVLRPCSRLRRTLLPRIANPHVREVIAHLDALPERRQEELTASSVARLESFLLDPAICRIITQRERTLDLSQILDQHKILLINLEQYRPFRPDDCKLLGRFIVDDLRARIFERPKGKRTPAIGQFDEAHTWVTPGLSDMLELGREMGFSGVLSHQHPDQLISEDGNRRLREAVMNNTAVKIIFGGSSVRNLQELTEEVFLDQYDPWTIKQELTSLELDPIEEQRHSYTQSESSSQGRGLAFPSSVSYGGSTTVTDGETESESEGIQDSTSLATTRGSTRGVSRELGTSETLTDSWAETLAESDSWAETDADSENWSETDGYGETVLDTATTSATSGASGSSDFGFTMDGNSNTTFSYGMNTGWSMQNGSSDSSGRSSSRSYSSTAGGGNSHAHTQGGSTMHATTQGGAVGHSASFSVGEQYSESESQTHGTTRGKSQEQGHAWSHAESKTESKTVTHGRTPSMSEEKSRSRSVTTAPFYAYRKRRNVTSREFLSKDDFLTLGLQKIKALPVGHFVVKVPGKRAVFARAPFIKESRITTKQLARAREQIFSQPYYTRRVEIEERPPLAVPYRETQVMTSHANAANKHTPRKPRRPKKATPAS